ncbi:MAG: hypothetical protein IPI73_22465 [Betaproteobacteria bacterium]|nr:hypothetical protein [Betaproteobacteria bacterium]
MAGKDVLCAMERLAIYHEHKQKDFAAAVHWTERMLPLSPQADAVEKRLRRLARKGKPAGGG